MKIEVYGTGCPKCKKTVSRIEEVLEETGKDAEIVKVEDVNDITAAGVMMTPAVRVDGETKVEGKVPGKTEIQDWL